MSDVNPLKDPWPKIETCRGCGLTHPHVEMLGIYHCPNPLCRASGSMHHKTKLKSFKRLPDTDKYTVDPQEVLDVLYPEALATGDERIIEAANRMKEFWE